MEDLYLLILESLIDRELVDIHFFPDALNFLNWFRKNRPDLLLCDINLPGMDGSELVQEIRRLEKNTGITQGVQISFVSGHHPNQFADVMKEHQVSHFITKPIATRETLAMIERDLGLVSP